MKSLALPGKSFKIRFRPTKASLWELPMSSPSTRRFPA